MAKNKDKPAVVKMPKEQKPNSRVRRKPKYKSFRLHRRIKHHEPPLPSWRKLLIKSLRLIAANKKAIFVFFVVYGILNLILVRGFSSPIDIEGLKESFRSIVGEDTAGLASGFTAFGLLVNASTKGTGEAAQVYQTFLMIFAGLSLIWLYRQQQAGNKVTMKMAFYRGMYPFVPFTLVLIVIGLQFIPALVGNFLFATVINSGLAVGAFENIIWLLLLLSTSLLSLYMVSSSAIALYVVTLPEMTPMIALRQARELVRFRRFSILRKVAAIIIVIFLLLTVVVLPVIFFAPTLAEWMFFSITVLGLPLVVGYMFSLYRELL